LSRFVIVGALVVLVVMALGQGYGCAPAEEYPSCVIACSTTSTAP
jgi:hypothetical protein